MNTHFISTLRHLLSFPNYLILPYKVQRALQYSILVDFFDSWQLDDTYVNEIQDQHDIFDNAHFTYGIVNVSQLNRYVHELYELLQKRAGITKYKEYMYSYEVPNIEPSCTFEISKIQNEIAKLCSEFNIAGNYFTELLFFLRDIFGNEADAIIKNILDKKKYNQSYYQNVNIILLDKTSVRYTVIDVIENALLIQMFETFQEQFMTFLKPKKVEKNIKSIFDSYIHSGFKHELFAIQKQIGDERFQEFVSHSKIALDRRLDINPIHLYDRFLKEIAGKYSSKNFKNIKNVDMMRLFEYFTSYYKLQKKEIRAIFNTYVKENLKDEPFEVPELNEVIQFDELIASLKKDGIAEQFEQSNLKEEVEIDDSLESIIKEDLAEQFEPSNLNEKFGDSDSSFKDEAERDASDEIISIEPTQKSETIDVSESEITEESVRKTKRKPNPNSFTLSSGQNRIRRIKKLYDFLVDKDFICKSTKITDFRAIFNNEIPETKIIWTGSLSELAYFIKLLHMHYKLIEKIYPSVWQVVDSIFVDDHKQAFGWTRFKNQYAPASQETLKNAARHLT